MKRLSLICIISFSLILILGTLWFFQTSALAESSDEISKAQTRLAELRSSVNDKNIVQEFGIDKLAENHSFEKIESVSYIDATKSTALAK